MTLGPDAEAVLTGNVPINNVLALPEVHAALSLFAEAIAGEPVPVEAAERVECWPAVPTDPARRRVVVPPELEGVDRRRYRAVALLQLVAHEDLGDDDPVDRDALHDEHPLLPATFGWLEDARIGALARRRYPGAQADLDAAAGQAGWIDAPALIQALRNACLGRGAPSYVRPQLNQLIARAVRAVIAVDATRDTSLAAAVDLLNAAGAVAMQFRGATESETEPPEGMESEGAGSALDSASTPDELRDREGVTGGQPIDEEMAGNQGTQAEDDDDDEPLGGLVLPVGRRAAAPDVRTYVYDEWDFRAAAHRTAWCRVLEERLVGDDPSFITDVRDRHRNLRSDIRRRLARLRPEQLVRIPRSDDGDELDLDAAIEAIIDRRSGAPVDDRLRIRRDRAERDVATVFLVDLSASTSSPVTEPEPVTPAVDPEDDAMCYAPIWDPNLPVPEPPRRVIDVAKDAVALLSDALTELGDRHAIFGFSGSGRENVQIRVVKELNDPVSPITWSALEAMRPMRYTRMGPAIRHAAMKLGADSARTRLLIVISDGYPQDVDYGDDVRDREYGMHDTARALADAQADGIDTFCLTIDPAGHDYLRDMAPERRYLVIDDVEALPEELLKVWLALSS